MAVGHVKPRKLLSAAALSGLGILAVLVQVLPAAATDADAYVITGGATLTDATSGFPPLATTYTLKNTTKCLVAGPFPGFVDLLGDESGPCTAVSGGGALTDLTACTTGLLTADWDLTENSGEVANFKGTGVLVGGVMIVAATSKHGTDGYRDPSTSSSAGTGVAVGLMVPSPAKKCGIDAVSDYLLDATVVGQY